MEETKKKKEPDPTNLTFSGEKKRRLNEFMTEQSKYVKNNNKMNNRWKHS